MAAADLTAVEFDFGGDGATFAVTFKVVAVRTPLQTVLDGQPTYGFDGRHPRAWLLTTMRNTDIHVGRRHQPLLLDDPDAFRSPRRPRTPGGGRTGHAQEAGA